MRFRRLHTPSFGAMSGRDLELSPFVVLIFGHNEAGKSTFQHALETAMFGFEPSRRELHPLSTWAGAANGQDLRLEADLQLDDGSVTRVERTLQATGKSRRAEAHQDFAGPQRSNAPLGELHGAARTLYRRIYSLSLDELRELGADVQDRVDHLLLPEAGERRLRPIFELVRDLEAEQNGLWRPDNRGKPLAAGLEQAVREEARKVQHARQEEQGLRDAYEEQDEVLRELDRLRKRAAALETSVRDAPLCRDLAEFERRRHALAPPVDLSPLEGLRLVDPGVLRDELEELERRLDEPRGRLALPAVELGRRDQLVLDQQEHIASFLQDARAVASLTEHRFKLRERIERQERELQTSLARLTGRAAGAEEFAALDCLPLEALRAGRDEWRAALDQRPGPGVGVSGWFGFLAIGLGLVTIGLTLTGLLPDLGHVAPFDRLPQPWILIGLVFVSLGFGALILGRVRRRPPGRPASIGEALGGLTFSDALVETPEGLLRLVESAERLQGLHRELEEDRAALAAGDEEERRWDARLRKLCSALDLAVEGEPDVVLGRMNRALEEATLQYERVREDEVARREALSSVAAIEPSLGSKRTHLARLRATLEAGVPGAPDVTHAYAVVRARETERERLQELERRLAADPRSESLRPFVRDQLRSDGEPPWTPRRVESADEELAALKARVSELDHRRGEIAARIESDPGSRVARAREAQAALEARLAEVRRERDRLALLTSVLRHAEEEHRREHQPDVLRRAGQYLAEVTGGRYTRPEYPFAESRALHVTPRGRTEPVPVGPPLSRGTIDQIYLCLRLGLLDHLDRAREGLPLVLDETLVNWDGPRRAAIYPLLRRVARRRQVILLTCHEAFADEVERLLGVRRIALT